MKDTLSNKYSSFVGTIAVADIPAYLSIWKDQTPLDFTTELAAARLDVTALGTDGAMQSAPTGRGFAPSAQESGKTHPCPRQSHLQVSEKSRQPGRRGQSQPDP